MFDVPLLLSCAYEWWDRRFPWFGQAICFYQEELAFPQSQKWLVAI
jgi:uncharacterized membrane protein YbaN (DUF454 family)